MSYILDQRILKGFEHVQRKGVESPIRRVYESDVKGITGKR